MTQEATIEFDRRQVTVIVVLALSTGLASLGTSIANIALPALSTAFAAPFPQVQAVVVAYLGALTMAVAIAGHLGDRYGLKPLLIGGLGVFSGASVLCGLAPNLWFLVAARAFQGAGAAFLMTLSMALMRQTAGEAHVGRAMGLLGTISALGTALGPAVGGLLTPIAGWRGVFWVQVPLALFTFVLALVALPVDPGEDRAAAPSSWSMLDWSIVPNLVVNLLVASVMMTTLVVGPFYLGIGLGLPSALVGLVMTVGPLISIFSGVPSGRLVDRWGCGRVIGVGLMLLAAGAFLMALLPNLIGVTGYLLSLVVLTPGYQLFQAANNTATLADVPKHLRGTVSGLLGLSRNIGLIAGATAMGAVFAFGAGTEELSRATPGAIAAGMRHAFLLAGGTMVIAIVVSRGMRRAA